MNPLLRSLKTIGLSLLIIVLLPANTANALFMQQDQASSLLAKASEKIKSFKNLEVVFSYEMENPAQRIQERMEGKLLSEGDRYRLEMENNLFVSDGITAWAYMGSFDEVHISHADDADMGFSPTALLDEFESRFRAAYAGTEKFQGRNIHLIDLFPKDNQAFTKYRLALDSSDHMPVFSVAWDRHGGTYTYTLKRIRTNIEIQGNSFRFLLSDFPGAEVIDLR